MVVAFSRSGNVFVGPSAGLGIAGPSVSIRAGTIFGAGGTDGALAPSEIDQYLGGFAGSVSVTAGVSNWSASVPLQPSELMQRAYVIETGFTVLGSPFSVSVGAAFLSQVEGRTVPSW